LSRLSHDFFATFRLDGEAFQTVQKRLMDRWTDVKSVAVVMQGRTLVELYRDGESDKLRNVQSVEKSALSALVGVALAQGAIASADQPVVALVPDWTRLEQRPAHPRDHGAAPVDDERRVRSGIGHVDHRKNAGGPRLGIPLAATPGERFAYDNAIVGLLAALIERVVGMPSADYARRGTGATARLKFLAPRSHRTTASSCRG